ncbi:MAG: hypothetical protein AB7O62_16975 [Pirellulales bacterium]
MQLKICRGLVLLALLALPGWRGGELGAEEPQRVAAIVSTYYHNSHADLIVGRLLQSHTLDGQGRFPNLKLVSLYIDQEPPPGRPENTRALMAQHNVPIHKTIRDALELGTGKLAVDGVLLVAEHGQYPVSVTGQMVYPKRQMFAEIATVCERSGRSVPVFVDKHLADNWRDAKWLYDEAARLEIPLMAGSSVPQTWRFPATDVPRDAQLREIFMFSYHTLDAYGFHALETLQALAERRAGGETGIRRVQTVTGDGVWQALEQQQFDRRLFDAALSRLKLPPPTEPPLREQVPEPVLWRIEYEDGLLATVLTLNIAVKEWAAAWRDADGNIDSTLFWTQEFRPLGHFSFQVDGIDEFIHTGQPPWPAERTLLTSGLLDELLLSQRDGGQTRQTPHLKLTYRSDWNWKKPPDPPPDRPLNGE